MGRQGAREHIVRGPERALGEHGGIKRPLSPVTEVYMPKLPNVSRPTPQVERLTTQVDEAMEDVYPYNSVREPSPPKRNEQKEEPRIVSSGDPSPSHMAFIVLVLGMMVFLALQLKSVVKAKQ